MKKTLHHIPTNNEKIAKNILESISDAVITTDLEFLVVTWNKAAENTYSWRAEEVIGQPITQILPQDSGKEELVEMVKQLRTQGFWKGDVIQQKQDGTKVYITSSVSVVKDDVGNPISIVAVNRDITERIQLEHRKDEFLGIASHELRTPLTSIKGYTQILKRLVETEPASPKISELLKRTDIYTDKLNGLINDLLDVSKIQAGKLVLNNSKFDIDSLVQESIESVQPTTSKHEIVYKNTVKRKIVGDRDRLEQVITNLLSNAIKYSPKSDKIEVTTTNDTKFIKITVRDFGIGIPKNKQSLLFHRYYRVEATEKTFSGMGIGLYICSEIVNRHKGTIAVASDGHHGTTFEVTLPIQL